MLGHNIPVTFGAGVWARRKGERGEDIPIREQHGDIHGCYGEDNMEPGVLRGCYGRPAPIDGGRKKAYVVSGSRTLVISGLIDFVVLVIGLFI